MSGYKVIQANQLNDALRSDGAIIDIRTHAEYADRRLELTHTHLPMEEVTGEVLMQRYLLNKDSSIYILCLGGKRAAIVASRLADEGFKNIHLIEGGLMACEKCGHEICK